MKKIIATTTVGTALFLIATLWGSAAAQEKQEDVPSVETIVARSNQMAYYQGRDGRADVNMRIVDAQGRTRSRRFTILRRDALPPEEKAETYEEDQYTGDQKFYVYFKAPPDVADTVFMVWKHVEVDRDDDRWLYLPDLDLVKRIAASDERTSFVGSHFFYEDVSGRNITEDKHELVDITDQYFVLDNTPKKPELVEFSHFKMWIHRETFLPIQTEYYDQRGEVYRKYKVLNVSRPQGFLTVTKSEMRDLRTGGHTTIEYSEVAYNVGLPEEIFTERFLRKPPMEHIKKE
jgi:hypothetical protein